VFHRRNTRQRMNKLHHKPSVLATATLTALSSPQARPSTWYDDDDFIFNADDSDSSRLKLAQLASQLHPSVFLHSKGSNHVEQEVCNNGKTDADPESNGLSPYADKYKVGLGTFLVLPL